MYRKCVGCCFSSLVSRPLLCSGVSNSTDALFQSYSLFFVPSSRPVALSLLFLLLLRNEELMKRIFLPAMKRSHSVFVPPLSFLPWPATCSQAKYSHRLSWCAGSLESLPRRHLTQMTYEALQRKSTTVGFVCTLRSRHLPVVDVIFKPSLEMQQKKFIMTRGKLACSERQFERSALQLMSAGIETRWVRLMIRTLHRRTNTQEGKTPRSCSVSSSAWPPAGIFSASLCPSQKTRMLLVHLILLHNVMITRRLTVSQLPRGEKRWQIHWFTLLWKQSV